MVLLFVGKLERYIVPNVVGVELPKELATHYSFIFNLSTFSSSSNMYVYVYVRAHIHRVFNEDGDVVKEISENIVAPVTGLITTYILDLSGVHIRYGIPIGYFLETLLISLIVKSGAEQYEVPIYPDEFRYSKSLSTPPKVSNLVEGYVRVLRELGSVYEVVGHLSAAGLQDIAADLLEGLWRFYSGDYEGSIKFFRKVVEGLRNTVEKTDVFGGNRKELLYQYLSKAFQLISNFGEHAGTRGSIHEARLSRDIALSASRYLAEYLRLKQGG
jgi:hypothetical protein